MRILVGVSFGTKALTYMVIHSSFFHGFTEKLNLGGNQFEGTIPTELGNLHALNELWLSLTNSFTGTIPTEIGKLSNLQCLALTQNKLQGPIPSEIGNLFKLKWIFLSDNKLEDSIPEELYECTQLEILFLSFNYLTGTISTRIGQLQKLSQRKNTHFYLYIYGC